MLGVTDYTYREITVFDKIEETVPNHTLNASLGLRQPWGSMGASAYFIQHLNQLDQLRLSLYGNADVRLFKGFSFYVYAGYSKIKDQIALRKGEATRRRDPPPAHAAGHQLQLQLQRRLQLQLRLDLHEHRQSKVQRRPVSSFSSAWCPACGPVQPVRFSVPLSFRISAPLHVRSASVELALELSRPRSRRSKSPHLTRDGADILRPRVLPDGSLWSAVRSIRSPVPSNL